ncbi:hypothetical protein BMF94_5302, partial [Rhodotorula taiwanensis]
MAHLCAKQQAADDDALAQVAAGLSLGDGTDGPMSRPSHGKLGKSYVVRTNTFAITPPKLVCYQYDVAIKPDEPKTPPRLNREIWRYIDKDMNIFDGIAVAYDGRSMAFSPRRLPADEGQWSVTLPDEESGGGGGGGGGSG